MVHQSHELCHIFFNKKSKQPEISKFWHDLCFYIRMDKCAGNKTMKILTKISVAIVLSLSMSAHAGMIIDWEGTGVDF